MHLDQLDLTDSYRTFHPAVTVCVLNTTWNIFKDIWWVTKQVSTNFKRLEITPRIFSDHSAVKLEIGNKRSIGNCADRWTAYSQINGSRKIKEEG